MAFATRTERLYGQLRDCFSGGYMLPQYCLEHKVERPLILGNNAEWLWEVYVQFRYDNRIALSVASFSAEEEVVNISPACVLGGLRILPLAKVNISRYDGVFVLETKDKCPMEAVEKISGKKVFYLDGLIDPFIQHVYAEIPLYHYLRANPGVKVIALNAPFMNKKNLSEYEQQILADGSIHKLRRDLNVRGERIISTRFDRFGYSNEEVLRLLELTGAKKQADGTTVLIDTPEPMAGVENGIRKTAHQPKEYTNTIYFMGTCTYYGIGAPYDKTVESYLQEKLNAHGDDFRVVNASQFYAGRYQDLFYNLQALSAVPGDIIFVCLQNLHADKIPFFKAWNLFDRPHDYGEVFADECHLNEHGYEILAEKIHEDLVSNNFYRDYEYKLPEEAGLHLYGIPGTVLSGGADVLSDGMLQRELTDYRELLSKERFRIGSIVMNCNPFTLGHRYLVEEASQQTDLLYIFVVEEDRSDFPFEDRFNMVKAGTADLANVKVLRSGKVVLSQQTFSGYFNKENLQGVDVDPSKDVKIFATEIAPSLGINIRFVGEEPEDTVTRQYNESMAEILPRHGIELKIMPRKQDDAGYISAGRVRRALRAGELEEMKKLLPVTTYDYIQNVNTGVALREKILSRGALLIETHQAYLGWHGAVFEGAVSGNTARDWALEAVRLHFSSPVGKLSYRVFDADKKWSPVLSEGEMAGSVGKAAPLYGIAIGLESDTYHVKYRVHVVGHGWSQWAKDGAGLMAKYPLNGLQVIIE